MHSEVTEAGPFERLLTLHIEDAELEDAKDAAARKLSQRLKIKGFRPGKAPRSIVERMVGADSLRAEAVDEATWWGRPSARSISSRRSPHRYGTSATVTTAAWRST